MNDWFAGDECYPPGGETASLRQARLEDAVRALSASPDGRYFLRWLIHGSGLFRAAFPPGHAEAAFLEGRRSMGLSVLQLCVNVGADNGILNNEVNDG